MADATSAIFNKKATEKLKNPDDLDRYVRVTNPSVWVILVACCALLAGLLCWGVFGTVSTDVRATGVVINGKAMCFLEVESAGKVNEGDSANVDGELMKVESISAVPQSRGEVRKLVGNDYLAETMFDGNWAYVVKFDGGEGMDMGVPVPVSITTERIPPISLVLGGTS